MLLVKILKPFVEMFPIIANFYRFVRDTRATETKVLFRDKLGFFFNGNDAMQNGNFEPIETLIIEQLLKKFDIFINIGANTGYYVCKSLSKGKNTIAFEPNNLNVIFLLKNIRANKFKTDFQFFPVALSDEVGVLPMYGASTGASLIKGWAGQKGASLVPISTFDKIASSLIKRKKCLVLIDIEGAEFKCLKGAKSLLSSNEDNVFLIEVSVTDHQPEGIKINPNLVKTFKLMKSFGYNAYTANTELRKIEISEIVDIKNSNINTLETSNFIFVKSKQILKSIEF